MKKSTKKIFRFILFLTPILMIVIFAWLKITRPILYTALIQEDAPLEMMEALAYFLASIGALITSIFLLRRRKTWHGALYAVLALGLILFSLEEISWGQRIVKRKTPAYFKAHNVQREISLHNLNPVQEHLCRAYILVGLYGSFAWLIVRQMKTRPD